MAEPIRPMPHMQRPIHHLRGEETLGWGIIGAGRVAGRHTIPAIRSQPPMPIAGARYPMTNSWVAGLYSHNERRAAAFADAHKLPHTYINLADLLKRPDIQCIYVACHPRHHAACTLAALAAGKHVLCEPPLALTVEEAHSVVQNAANRGLCLGVNYVHRGDPALLALRELLHGGEIGETLGGRILNATFLRPEQQTWRLRAQGGGVLFDRATYSIDTLRFLWRDEIEAVDCFSHQQVFESEVEEDVLSRFTLRRSGHTIQSHDSFVIPHQPTEVEVFGSGGVLVARGCFQHDTTSELYIRRQGENRRIRLAASDPFATAIARFHAAVRHGDALQANGTDAIAVLAAALASHESIRRSHRVSLQERPGMVSVAPYLRTTPYI